MAKIGDKDMISGNFDAANIARAGLRCTGKLLGRWRKSTLSLFHCFDEFSEHVIVGRINSAVDFSQLSNPTSMTFHRRCINLDQRSVTESDSSYENSS